MIIVEPVEPVGGRVVREASGRSGCDVVAAVALAAGSTDRRRRRRRRCRRAGRALRPRRLSVAGCARRRRCRCTPARAPRRRARASSAPPSTSAREMGDRSIVIPPPVVRTDAGGTLSSPARTCGPAPRRASLECELSVSGGDPPITSQRACARARRAAPASSRHGCARPREPGGVPRAARGAARGLLPPRPCRTCRSPATCSPTSSSTTGARCAWKDRGPHRRVPCCPARALEHRARQPAHAARRHGRRRGSRRARGLGRGRPARPPPHGPSATHCNPCNSTSEATMDRPDGAPRKLSASYSLTLRVLLPEHGRGLREGRRRDRLRRRDPRRDRPRARRTTVASCAT